MPVDPFPLLSTIGSPQDLRGMSPDQLPALAGEIRAFLIDRVSQTGGHLGPNLGVVELTIALHRVFESPRDPILFDTGHQSYVHKMLTGRQDRFPTLRQRHGLSGYPSPEESEHDWVANSHASTALSYADGLAKAIRLQGRPGTAVALVGDGSLTGGMAWEALNNIAASDDLPLVIVVNDNGRSYTPTVGGLANHLSALRTNPRYEQILDVVKRGVSRAPLVGTTAYELLHGIKTGLKDVLAPQGMFSDLGLKYVGPIDGHDVAAVERALVQARQFGGPVLVHCLTRKGEGFKAAEDNEEDRFHAVGKIDASTGASLGGAPGLLTDVFAEELLRLGATDERVVAITAAMLYPTGLNRFAAAFPDRCFDVGIAEQHAVTSAAGLAMGGLHPVVAVYATFLNRAFDQLLMDVALHRCGVTFVLDRAGITGPDGASHHGMWDMSITQLVPGLHLAAPRDGTRLREALATSLTVDDGPSVLRYSKDQAPPDLVAVDQVGGLDVLFRTEEAPRVLVVGYGPLAFTAVAVGERLADQGIGVTVVDPVWALPVNPRLLDLAAGHELVVTIEDNGVVGGCGARLAQELRLAEIRTPVREFGIPQQFLDHGSRAEILAEVGLSAQEIARYAVEAIARADEVLEQPVSRADSER